MTTATAAHPVSIQITRTIRAPRQRVYEALINASDLKHWKGPHGWTVPEVTSDARVGGKFRVTMRGTPAGATEEVTGDAWGEYLELVPYETVRFTWNAVWMPGEETIVTYRLTDVDEGTHLVLTHENFSSQTTASNHEIGWEQSTAKLAAYLEQ